jgi:hypothetical protein
MTEQPNPTTPRFVPVPAFAITVLPTPKGMRAVRTDAGVFVAATLREAIEAARQEQTE